MAAWFAQYYETIIGSGYYTLLLDGLKTTIIITLGALVIGVVIGTLIAGCKLDNSIVVTPPSCFKLLLL